MKYETFEQVHAGLDELVRAMIEKSVLSPVADFTISSGSEQAIWLRSPDNLIGEYGYAVFRADTATEMFAKAKAHISALPDPENVVLNNYVKDLAKVVDKGRKDGVPDEYTDPVSLTIKAVYENLLPAPKGGE